MLFQELHQARRQPVAAESYRGGDLQLAGRLVAALRQQRLGHRQLGENLAHRLVQAFALLRQDQAARVTVEQWHLQRLFQRGNLPADGGLAQVQRVAGVGEAAGFRDGVEDTQLVPIHGSVLFRRRRHPTPAASGVFQHGTRSHLS